MKTLTISKHSPQHNCTPCVISALSELKNGGTLKFEAGEYHFFPDGAVERFLAPTNNANGIKKLIFPIFDTENLTIDGGGATFVFHADSFPFAVVNSQNISFKNFTLTTAKLPYVRFTVGKIRDDGFFLDIDQNETSYTIDNDGHFFVLNEDGSLAFDPRIDMYPLHSLERICIRYLFTGECSASKENLATFFHDTVAEYAENGIFLRYVGTKNSTKCSFYEGEKLATLVAGRTRDVFFLAESSEVDFSHITIHRGLGMGIIAQCCHNVNVDAFCALPINDEPATLTADALHFVNCTGTLNIKNCDIRRTMDDMLNVHGIYTFIKSVSGNEITVGIGHHEQSFFLPYHKGDKLRIIERATLDIKGYLTFEGYRFTDSRGMEAVLTVKEEDAQSAASAGDIIEVPDRMPNLNFVGNRGYDIPRVLMAGGKKYYYADNEIHGFMSALNAVDVPDFWYESGRVEELIVENNIIDGIGKHPDTPAFTVAVEGFVFGHAPKVHGKVVIRNNRFLNMGDLLINADGIQDLTIENNMRE